MGTFFLHITGIKFFSSFLSASSFYHITRNMIVKLFLLATLANIAFAMPIEPEIGMKPAREEESLVKRGGAPPRGSVPGIPLPGFPRGEEESLVKRGGAPPRVSVPGIPLPGFPREAPERRGGIIEEARRGPTSWFCARDPIAWISE